VAWGGKGEGGRKEKEKEKAGVGAGGRGDECFCCVERLAVSALGLFRADGERLVKRTCLEAVRVDG
jgi:hypothetical protein